MLTAGDRELELALREVDRVVDRALVQLGESELEQMAGLGALQALARVGSGLGRVSSGLSRVSGLGRAAGSLGRATGSVGRVTGSLGRATGSVGSFAGRRRYPSFTPPTRADMPMVLRLARDLQRQSKLRIRPSQILDAPWIGRGTSRSTSEGWLRDSRDFWRVFARHSPRAYAALGSTHRVTPAYARLMGWPASTIGQKLIHHHILNSHFVVPLPASDHGAAIHRHWTYGSI